MLVCDRKILNVSNPVQAVGKSYENDSGIITHGEKHVADGIRLMNGFSVNGKI